MYILKCNHQQIENRGVVIERTPSDERMISPISVRQFIAFLAQFEHGVVVHLSRTDKDDFVIEVLSCPTQA